MLSIRSLVEGLGVFERVPLEFKILGLVYIQLSSFRRAARALSEVHRVSKQLWRGSLVGGLMLIHPGWLGDS